MSKGTIREAMRLLQAQGLIETKTGPGGGSFVGEVTRERAAALLANYFYFRDVTIDDIYQVRIALEPELAASLAGRLSEAQIAELEVIMEDFESKKVPVTVYAESTPNPSAMKFVANKKLVTNSFEFTSIDDAKFSPLATQLVHLPFVKAVFMDENYISITKYEVAEWNDITLELREFIRSYIENGKDILQPNAAQSLQKTTQQLDDTFEALDDTSKEIINILEEYVKPAVASDGGNIQFQSYNSESKTVKVILQGACSGCPSSTFTLKNGIENMLKEMLKGKVETVEAING